MSESLVGRCEHQDCGVDNRLEYCEQEPLDPAGSIADVTGLIDGLMCAPSYVADSEFHASFGPDEGLIYRQFPELALVGDEVFIETFVGLEHTLVRHPSCDRYAITIGRVIEKAGVTIQKEHTGYSIDVYPAGAIQARICEDDAEEPRRMTPFDASQLHKQLIQVADLHLINQHDIKVQ